MNIEENKNYEALKESDKLYNRNDAEKYLKKFEKSNNKIVNLNMKYENTNQKYFPKYFLLYMGINAIFLLINTNFILWLAIIFIILWTYSLISVLKNDFKKDSNRTIWILLLLFLPISCYLYSDFRDIQVKENN